MSDSRSRLKYVGVGMLLFPVMLLVIWAIMEIEGQIGFRIREGYWYPTRPTKYSDALFIRHPWLVGSPAPNVYLKIPDGYVSHNSHGYRGPEFDYPKNGRTRIVCYGASTTYGTQASNDKIWTTLLEKKL